MKLQKQEFTKNKACEESSKNNLKLIQNIFEKFFDIFGEEDKEIAKNDLKLAKNIFEKFFDIFGGEEKTTIQIFGYGQLE